MGFIKKGQSSGLNSALNLLCDLKPGIGKGREGIGASQGSALESCAISSSYSFCTGEGPSMC